MICRICSRETAAFRRARIMGRHEVQYFHCPGCGFIQTEEPYWLAEAYADPINASDVGLVARNLATARATRAVINLLFRRDGPFVDYGGGYGLFVRLLRDAGYDFYRYDPHCANLFAKGLDAAPGEGRYELLTAFEVFEHLARPVEGVEEMLRFADSVLFTTTLVPAHLPAPEEWWYYSLDHGQHVSLYSPRSLAALAGRLGLRLYSDGASAHMLTRRRLPAPLFRLAVGRYGSRLLSPLRRRPSLIPGDYARVTGRRLS